MVDALGNETDFYYNLAGQLTLTVYPTTSGSSTMRAVEYTAYQYPGGPASAEYLFSEGTITSYPPLGAPYPSSTYPAPTLGGAFRATAYTYGAGGQVTDVTDLKGLLKHYDYDGLYHLIDEEDGLGNTTLYRYNQDATLLSIQYPNNPGSNSPGTFDSVVYGFDHDQNVTSRTDGRDVVTTYARVDPESLVTGVSYNVSGTGGTVPAYGSVAYTYDALGRKTYESDPTGDKSYDYDDLGDLLSLGDGLCAIGGCLLHRLGCQAHFWQVFVADGDVAFDFGPEHAAGARAAGVVEDRDYVAGG